MILIYFILGLLISPFVLGNKPVLQELYVPRNLSENKTIKLMCGSIQGDQVEFEWYHNNQKLRSNEKTKIILNQESSDLVIKSLSIDDLGVYRCLGKNKYGEDQQTISLGFNVKPKFTKEPYDLVDRLGKEITTECVIVCSFMRSLGRIFNNPPNMMKTFSISESYSKNL